MKALLDLSRSLMSPSSKQRFIKNVDVYAQVAVLSDQIDSATDKINDMEKLLDDKKEVLRKTEELLQREILTRSSLETQKLELMSTVTNLKLRQANIDQENIDLRKRYESQIQMISLFFLQAIEKES